MTTLFAHSKHPCNAKVCWEQFDVASPSWHTANMRYRIRTLRKERGWTIDHLADLTGISRGYISQLETGKREPSSDMLDTLSEAFGVATPDLYADRDLGDHLVIMRGLSPEDRDAVLRHAVALAQKVDQKVSG